MGRLAVDSGRRSVERDDREGPAYRGDAVDRSSEDRECVCVPGEKVQWVKR